MNSNLLLLLLLLLLTTISSCTPTQLNFKEAPQFLNSPKCPSILPHALPCSPEAVHVAMTLDTTYLRGSIAAIHSILQHSSCPQNIFFHFVTSPSSASPLRASILAAFPYLNRSSRIYTFHRSTVSHLISTSIRAALDSPLNYARTYLPTLIPLCVTRVVYLDSDLILVDDIAKLAATDLGPAAVLAAPEYCNANLTAYFTPSFWSNPVFSAALAGRRVCYFNTGVMVIDTARWRVGDCTRRIEEWMEVQKRVRIYELGSLPPFLLVFGGEIVAVDHRWNQHGLGGDNFMGLCRALHAGPVSLLHWSGKGKPWARLDSNRPCPLDALWAPYDLLHHAPFSFPS